MNGKDLEDGQKRCRTCKTLFKSNKVLKNYCSIGCRDIAYRRRNQEGNKKRIEKLNQRFVDTLEGFHFIKCPVCGQKVREISVLHAKYHGFAFPKELANEYGLNFTKCQQVRENKSGKNNPGYQHNGKCSPWSKNSQYHTEEQILQSKEKAIKNSKGKTSVNFSYWLAKCNGDVKLAKEKHYERQSNGLTKMIKLYGHSVGFEKWKNRQIRWQNSLNSKSAEEKAEINRKKLSVGYFISNKELFIFEELKNHFSDLETQFYLRDEFLNRGFSFDFRLNNKLIEFFGDFWHHNPSIYAEEWINPVSKISSKERWNLDKQRIDAAVRNGFEIIVIWELDYKRNKDQVVKECITFLM